MGWLSNVKGHISAKIVYCNLIYCASCGLFVRINYILWRISIFCCSIGIDIVFSALYFVCCSSFRPDIWMFRSVDFLVSLSSTEAFSLFIFWRRFPDVGSRQSPLTNGAWIWFWNFCLATIESLRSCHSSLQFHFVCSSFGTVLSIRREILIWIPGKFQIVFRRSYFVLQL